jgi:hypothetical protein
VIVNPALEIRTLTRRSWLAASYDNRTISPTAMIQPTHVNEYSRKNFFCLIDSPGAFPLPQADERC